MVNSYEKEFIRLLEEQKFKIGVRTLFADFCRCVLCGICSPVSEDSDRWENEYRKIVSQYPGYGALIAELLGNLLAAMEQEPFTDILGRIYMKLDMGNGSLSQVFTPSCISALCGKMVFDENTHEKLANGEVITLSDCCVGSGGMMLSYAGLIHEAGYNPQTQLRITCNDIDSLCVAMAFIQLTFSGLKACIWCGDTFSQEPRECFYTPFWFVPDDLDRR